MKVIQIGVMLVVGSGIYILSGRLMLVITLFVVGSVVASGIEKGKDLTGSFVLHKCCSAVEWALMSFYLFIFESLPSHHPDGKYYLLVGILLFITLGVYVFASANAQTVLAGTDLHLFKTHAERMNVFFATSSVILITALLAYLRFYLGIAL